jgi:hypothetical protein
MKRSVVLFVLIIGLVGALAAVPALAGPMVLYDNTTALSNTSIASNGIFDGVSASTNSFTLSQTSSITGINFNALLQNNDVLSTVDYSITTDYFGGTTEASGTVSPSGVYVTSFYAGVYKIYEESFSIPSLYLGGGTYWLQLQNALGTNNNSIYWGESDGPSIAYIEIYGGSPLSLSGSFENGGTGSDTFQIMGEEENVTPEPSSFLLLGSGLAGLAGLIKRKLMA